MSGKKKSKIPITFSQTPVCISNDTKSRKSSYLRSLDQRMFAWKKRLLKQLINLSKWLSNVFFFGRLALQLINYLFQHYSWSSYNYFCAHILLLFLGLQPIILLVSINPSLIFFQLIDKSSSKISPKKSEKCWNNFQRDLFLNCNNRFYNKQFTLYITFNKGL